MKTALLASLLLACASEPQGSIDDYLRELPHLPSEASARVEGAPGAPEQGANMVCVTQPIRETRQHDNVVALAANSESLWAGSLVRGDAVYTGLFTPIALDRAPMKISVSLANLAGAQSATLESPSLSAYREALASLLAQSVTGATPANMSVEISKIDTEQQLELALGVNATFSGLVNVKAGFDWTAASQKSRYLVKFTQSYFTVDVDTPASPGELFAPSVSLGDVKKVADHDNPPVYVSSITYGRTVLFMFESDTTSDELGVALDATYKGPGAAGGNLSVRDKDVLAQSKISAYVLGGAGGEAVKAIDGIDSLLDFIKTGGDYSPASPGAPIAFKLAHVADNEPARLSFTQDYQIKTCTASSGSVRVTLETITLDSDAGELDGTIEAFGIVTVSTTGGNGAVLMQTPRVSPLVIKSHETFPSMGSIKDAIVPVGVTAGAYIDVNVGLQDADGNGDDMLGNASYRIDLNGGWQRDFNIILTGTNKRVLVHVTTEPML